MKKIFIFTALVLGLNFSVCAQFKFGIKAGLNVSNFSTLEWQNSANKGETKYNYTTGFVGGGYVNYIFNSAIGVQGELLFSMQGGKVNNVGTVVRRNYVNVPLLLNVTPVSSVPIALLAGVQLGYCLNEYADGKKNEAQLEWFDFSAAVGAQYTFIEHLTLGARYNIGITPTQDSKLDENTTLNGARNNVFQFSVGWTF